jgi:hypothetical protein
MRHVRGPEQLTPWKEVPSVEIYTYDVAAARTGAACLGARSPWTSLAAAGANHALMQNAAAAGSTDARRAAFRAVPAPQQLAPTQHVALMAAELLPTVNHPRKQTNVQKTRIGAGGYGAMGPHPEREQPA